MVYEVAYYVTRSVAALFFQVSAPAIQAIPAPSNKGNYKLPVAAAGARSASQAPSST